MIGSNGEHINGYLERKANGRYEGEMCFEGITLSPITGVMFEKDDKKYIWLKRKDMLVYDMDSSRYVQKKREPRWEAYLVKQIDGSTVAYKGEFCFMTFCFSIVGIWDRVVGWERGRMNFFVERLPMNNQKIINSISKRKWETTKK